jgi:hypothetical protein
VKEERKERGRRVKSEGEEIERRAKKERGRREKRE